MKARFTVVIPVLIVCAVQSLQAQRPAARATVADSAVAPASHSAIRTPHSAIASRGIDPFPLPKDWPSGEDLYRQTTEDAEQKSWGCKNCHTGVHDMHNLPTVRLGCIDCHGGDAACPTKKGAHVLPRFPQAWPNSANPVRTYTLLNHETPEFIRFVNPGDLRIAHISCGGCHAKEVLQVKKSMMTHGCMLWGAALYNNGSVPRPRLESLVRGRPGSSVFSGMPTSGRKRPPGSKMRRMLPGWLISKRGRGSRNGTTPL